MQDVYFSLHTVLMYILDLEALVWYEDSSSCALSSESSLLAYKYQTHARIQKVLSEGVQL